MAEFFMITYKEGGIIYFCMKIEGAISLAFMLSKYKI